jgi:hypothetical protein
MNCVPFETSHDPLIETLKTFWNTESIGIKDDSRYNESSELFNESVRFNGERYEVELPWKEDVPQYQMITNYAKID